jgi:hypothetical protein
VATIECYANPPRLYRYRSLRHFDREIEAIEKGFLFCSAYNRLNDPMEGLFKSSRLLKKTGDYRSIIHAITDTKNRTGICSFTEVYDHELMWAHYADRFRGICIGYSLSRLLENLEHGFSFVRMYYNEQVPQILSTNTAPELLAKKVLSFKNHRWSYEREWRMFGEQGRAQYDRVDCISHVYLGSQIPSRDRTKIVEVLKALNIEISVMVIDEYTISFEGYDEHSKYLWEA